MNDARIKMLAEQFRKYIEIARDSGRLKNDILFKSFPHACCGSTSYLLAEFLHANGVETIYVCGEDCTGQTHAWLVAKDDRIHTPISQFLELPEHIRNLLNSYGSDNYTKFIDVTKYKETDIERGLIIDITADQFGEVPVYVGYINDFYRKFVFKSADDYETIGNLENLGNKNLVTLYNIILSTK